MNEALTHIDTAFGVLMQIPVKGDDVEKMMVVKQELKKAYSVIKSTETDSEKG